MSTIILVALLAVVGVIFAGLYNGLIAKKIAVEGAWAQIEVQLKRRHDLVPNLVETVKGYAKHEKETLDAVIKARNTAVSASGPTAQIAAEAQLSGSLKQLFALSEAYPDLKANENFVQLQNELATTENLIAGKREWYNTEVGTYNTAIQQVPGNLVASIAGFKAKPFFELSATERTTAEAPPKVSF